MTARDPEGRVRVILTDVSAVEEFAGGVLMIKDYGHTSDSVHRLEGVESYRIMGDDGKIIA